ncbi:serine hydrolase domain-containing protein [Dyella humicola]|uniref:serine hydrolase domain-containing protein n=1 Tax=Dyella humicola TaxID=2992126 RepID=UPI002254A52A|nr:serine hydrolase domain-containing protein [Dyella humicola]
MSRPARAAWKRAPIRLRLLVLLALCVISLQVAAQAQIQITPIPEQKRATAMPLGANALTASDAASWLDPLVADAMRRAPIAGAVVVVVKDSDILLSKGYGYADASSKKPIDPATTLFRAGSLSKLFTATAVMQLVEQGKLDLDADVNRFLDFSIPPRDGKPVTLRELMTHTAGFEDVVKDLYVPDASSLISNEAWLKRWVPARIFPAGEVTAYSNYGAALAGYIVQRVAGEPFETYIEQHIFQPLGMTHATFRQPLPPSLLADMAGSYLSPSGPPFPLGLIPAVPAGALSISGNDMARFMIAHLQDGHVGDAQLLRGETVKQMHSYARPSVPGLRAIGLGFYHLDRNGQDIIGQTSNTRFFHSALALFGQQHVGLFVSVDGADDGGLRRQLLNGFADRYFPPLPQIKQPTLTTARAHGASIVGRYLGSKMSVSNFRALRNLLTQMEVSMAADGTLRTPGFDELVGPAHWREVKPYLWVDDASGSHLGADVKDGRVRWISIDELAPTQVFLPVPAWLSPTRTQPLLAGILAVFLLAALSWPVAVLMRRVLNKPVAWSDWAGRWYRLSCVTAILQLLFAAGWWVMLPRLETGTSQLDTRLRLLQLVGLLACLGTIAVAMNAWHAWREPGGWWRKLGSLVLLLVCLVAVWFTFSWHLLSAHLYY